MGVGGHFWDLLKPYARPEGFEFLRDKRVAVDLSFWIVQHETAIKAHVRNPHLRLTFFRTINLFAKFGAFPVFVLDGTPSQLKSKARIARFFRFSGIDMSSLTDGHNNISVERNRKFTKCVNECVDLLELFGMPVLKAKGEAEALCAQLNREGHVDACITADSDAFLYGAKCLIKLFCPNSKEPFECYLMSDIEAGLGLKRKHLIAISLLVGNDHDLNGVQGIGIDNAVRFAREYDEDEILNRLHEIGSGKPLPLQSVIDSTNECRHSSEKSSPKIKGSHCTFCGHPGNKRAHIKSNCDYCDINNGCIEKPEGFKCNCPPCIEDRKEKVERKQTTWRIKVCDKIASEPNFPNGEIIQMYLREDNGPISADDDFRISWGSPKTEMLVDFLAFHQPWEPRYIRQRMLPMLSTIFLREMAANHVESLLYGQYKFDSIHREKIRYGHKFFVVKWKKAVNATGNITSEISTAGNEVDAQEDGVHDELLEISDQSDAPEIHFENGECFLITDENMDLVRSAFPKEVDNFLKEKELTESRKRKSSKLQPAEISETSQSRGVQLNITEFYRSTKVQFQEKSEEDDPISNTDSRDGETSKQPRNSPTQRLSKSVRRRLLFH